MMKRPDRTLASPLSNEVVVRTDLSGRATAAYPEALRPDFRLALEALVLRGESIERLIAIRASETGRRPQPAGVIALTDRAVLRLHASGDLATPGYGVRSVIVALADVVAVELSERFLRGLVAIHTTGALRIEVFYHAHDERLFIDFVRAIRVRMTENMTRGGQRVERERDSPIREP